ncbi:hypothetical protein [Rossellomorea aquimaris]|uniref:hypothetical protein n=1 Tax=Rossellomorea aquimaris TaxID=189382 RepID=UPI0005C8F7B3|nr:hypothetical protein [Rossellomorea aquimaris]
MKESIREKNLRLVLIGLCLLIVLGGFVYSSASSEQADVPEQSIHAEVLSAGNGERNPVIAVAKMVQDQPVLIIYELDRSNQYYFKVLHSVSLKKTVKKVGITKEENGIWVQLDNKQWVLFSDSLEVLQEEKEAPSRLISSQQPFEYDEQDQMIGISLRGNKDLIELDLSDRKAEPVEVHPLSVDESLWLVVFQEDLVLAQG